MSTIVNTVASSPFENLVTTQVDSSTGKIKSIVDTDGSSIDIATVKRRGSRLIGGKPILRAPASASGVLLSPNVTIAATTRRGRACWEVTFPAESTNKSVYWPITSRTYTDKIHAVIEVEDAAEWNGGSWRIALFTDINLTNGMRYVQTVGANSGWTGIHQIAPLSTEWVAVGTGSWSSTMTYAAFQATRKSSPTGTTRIWIYEMCESEKSNLPSIIIGADDGHGTWYSGGIPLCEKYGFSSYLAYIHDSAVAGGSSMTVAQWQDVVARGHHAVVHGCKAGVNSLRDYFTNYTGYPSPYAAMLADITYNRDGMVSNGLDPDGRGRHFYVLPQGFHQPSGGAGDTTVMSALADAGMKTCRMAFVQGGVLVNGGMSGSRMYITILGHSYAGASEATNISNLVTAMQNEIAAGRSVVFMFHQTSTSPTIAEQISPANLEILLSAANDLVLSGAAKRGKLTDYSDELDTYTPPIQIGL